MTFSDIFKSSFLESVTEFSPLDVLLGMVVALVVGLFIFVIYKKTFTGVMYSTGFALTLVGLALVTTLVIMAVTSNVVLSLGMIGSAIIGVVLLLFANRKSRENPYILVINCADETAEQAALGLVKDAVSRYGVKTKTVSADGIELTAELRTRNNDTAFVNRIMALPGVSNATLVSYNGEYMS